MDIIRVLETGSVLRYHTTLIDRKQTLAEHSWEVGVILRHIYPKCSADLLFYALTHDAGEAFTGDIPAPLKKKHPSIKVILDDLEDEYLKDLGIERPEFTDEEMLAVKWADTLSGLYYTSMRRMVGDQHANDIREVWLGYAIGLQYLNDEADQLLRYMYEL